MLPTSLIHGESADTALVGTGTNRGDRTLLVSPTGLEQAKKLISSYKQNHIHAMTPELWHAKKVVDSTLHPGMRWT